MSIRSVRPIFKDFEGRFSQFLSLPGFTPETERVSCVGLNRKGHVIQGGKIFEDACDLEGPSQSQGAATVFRDLSNVAIFETILPESV